MQDVPDLLTDEDRRTCRQAYERWVETVRERGQLATEEQHFAAGFEAALGYVKLADLVRRRDGDYPTE